MLEAKLIELRDKGTFIPMLAVRVQNLGSEADYLLRRVGFITNPGVFFLHNPGFSTT